MTKTPASTNDRTAPLSPPAVVAATPPAPNHESLAHLHPAPGCDVAADDRCAARWPGRVPAASGLGAARSRLPDDSNCDDISRRQSGRHGLVGYRSTRAAVWPNAGASADDVDELDWPVAGDAAVCART